MQTLTEKSKIATDAGVGMGNGRYFVGPSTPSEKSAPVTTFDSNTNEDINEDGFIMIKEGVGVFYIRYDIIFAKAGDIFFMPRKVPQNFNSGSDKIITLKAEPGEFDKYFNAN